MRREFTFLSLGGHVGNARGSARTCHCRRVLFVLPVSTNPKRRRVTCSRDNRTVKRAFLTELPVLAAVDTNMKRIKMHALVLLSICLSVGDKIFIRIAIQRAPYTRQLSILVDKSEDPFIARMIFQKSKSHRLWLKLR